MTNDKDSEVLVEDFEIIVGSKHHKTKVSQSELLRLINGGAKIHHIKALRQPAQSDEEGPCLKCNAAGDDCGEHAPSWEELSVYWKAEAERLRQPAQSDVLRGALEGVLPYVLTNYFRCNGDKCRHPTCESCCGEDFAESQSDKANLALSKAKAALAALQEQSK